MLDQKYLDFVKVAYQQLKNETDKEDVLLPENGDFTQNFDFKKRQLDCSAIRYAHPLACEGGELFDSVRAAFMEGNGQTQVSRKTTTSR